MNEYKKGYNKAIEDALDIIKHKPLFPPIMSQKIFLAIKALSQTSETGNEVKE